MHQIKIRHNDKLTKVRQIVQSLTRDIAKGILQKDDRLLSINEFSEKYVVARDTVEKAYKELREEGYIISVAAKGYYVAGIKEQRLKVLLIFNKLSSYKKRIYDSLVETLGEGVRVDLHIHNYNPKLLKEIVEEALGNYHYYVIMPHFFHHADEEGWLNVLQMIPPHELVLLDKNLPELEGGHMAVFQDFKEDIYEALCSAGDALAQYDGLTVVFSRHSNHPKAIVEGVLQACLEQGKEFKVLENLQGETLRAGNAYIVISESDLAQLIKKIRLAGLELGKDIGVISFNETALKELLEITVVTTDFEQMGRITAQLIKNKQYTQIKNPFQIIRRHSF